MRNLIPSCVIAALAAGCAIVPPPHRISSSLDLGDGGSALARITTTGTDYVSLRVDNTGPASVTYRVRDDLRRELEQGEFGRGVHVFEWRPLDRTIELELLASGSERVHLDYALSSRSAIAIEWNLTHALPAARP